MQLPRKLLTLKFENVLKKEKCGIVQKTFKIGSFEVNETVKKCVTVFAAAVAIAVLYAVLYCGDTSITEADVKRPNFNGSSKVLSVNVGSSDGADFDMDITIEPQQYSEDNIEQAFDEAEKIIDKKVLAENESVDNVTKSLNLVDSADGFPFTVQWIYEDYELINYDGSINNIGFEPDESRTVDMRYVVKYEGWTREKEFQLTVRAPDMENLEIRQQWIKNRIEEAAAKNPDGEYVELPDSISGAQITYSKPAEWSSVAVIILLGAAAAATIYLGEKKKKIDEAKKRTKELKRDYSEMIHKLALLMGAGMTVRMAWEHIVNEYRERLAGGKTKKKYVYEEMSYTLYQMGSGISEINAYGEFGTRCDTKEYLKFSSLIVQNLKKGSRELVNLLELEAIDAFEERKNQAKKYGEEAGTKMLFPMVGMLVVVMGIIMFPALISFSM
jgi:hypothetical protein